MFDRLTSQSIKVIMLAQEEARLLGYTFIGTEQLLLGLMGERSGRAARTLSQFGLDLRQMRQEVEAIIGRGSGVQTTGEIPFTERAKNSLRLALEISQECNSDYIHTEYLLVGLLDVEGGVAKSALQNLGIDLSELRSRLLQTEEETIDEMTAFSSDLYQEVELLITQLYKALSKAEAISRKVDDRLNVDADSEENDLTAYVGYSLDFATTNRLEMLSDTPRSDQPGLKECLKELGDALMGNVELTNADKADAREQLLILIEASVDHESRTMPRDTQRAARLAVKVLWGTTMTLTADSPLIEVSNRCLPIIKQQLGLDEEAG
ncbi:Clp protease N-terminal domain-containing protein [Vacuolonema iberomarrocanum]|uniref:Clp protease N-terminal domain-containing protein n=1 Tax=Vacuolonema iberomarrocanum TaxID=3454632 RepID=UPI0019E5965A|nr:hypothetical protein [filamentous cyanobacterium LEGE 07170]